LKQLEIFWHYTVCGIVLAPTDASLIVSEACSVWVMLAPGATSD